MAEKKVAAEVAEQEFARFVETMELDVEPKGWTDEDKQSFLESKRRIVEAMERGQLIVDEEGRPVYTPRVGNTEPITFYEPTGADLMAIDQAKKGATISAAYKVLAAMTKTDGVRFAKMANRDLKVCQAVQALFLA
jgi:hypothetical protein